MISKIINKSILIKINQSLSFIGLNSLIVSAFFSEYYSTLPNLALILCFLSILIDLLISHKITSILPSKIIFIFLAFSLISPIICILNEEGYSIMITILKKQLLWPTFAIIFAYLPIQSRKYEFFQLFLFGSIASIISIIAIYLKFEILEFNFQQNHTKIGFLPLKMPHHLLSVILNISLVYFFYIFNFYRQRLLLLVIVLLIILINLIGSRVGILILYLNVFFWLIKYSTFKRIKYHFFLFASIISLSMILFLTNRSFKENINTAIDEVQYIVNTDFENIEHRGNFTMRIVTFKNNLDLINKNFWTGVSQNNYEDRVYKNYEYIGITTPWHKELPANQWIRNIISYGIPLGIISFLFFFMPFFMNKNYTSFLSVSYLTCIFVYSFTETPLNPTLSLYIFSITFPMTLRIIYLEKIQKN